MEGDRTAHVPRGRALSLLALLLVHRGDVVHLDRVADELWEGEGPQNARNAVHVVASRLRAVLGDEEQDLNGSRRAPHAQLLSSPSTARSREATTCTALRAFCGPSPSHSSSATRSRGTTSPRCTSSSASSESVRPRGDSGRTGRLPVDLDRAEDPQLRAHLWAEPIRTESVQKAGCATVSAHDRRSSSSSSDSPRGSSASSTRSPTSATPWAGDLAASRDVAHLGRAGRRRVPVAVRRRRVVEPGHGGGPGRR